MSASPAPEPAADTAVGAAEAARQEAEAAKRKAILAIMLDPTLTEAEKARKRQALMMGNWAAKAPDAAESEPDAGRAKAAGIAAGPASAVVEAVASLDENLKCAICMDLCDRPVTAPCQHSFCLACFHKWVAQAKKTCPTCRAPFPAKFAQNPRINTSLIVAIRLAKNPSKAGAVPREYHRVDNDKRPDEAFKTERAKREGRANAASGRIMVAVPNDHFGPIEAQHDPERNRGVLVGDHWRDRLDCRQWGAHFPHVAGIAGQSNVGAQSVVLSGGYEDDKDEGEWFLYTGSGGRDLSGNKRTNKEQSSDQEFEALNKALMMSCVRGLPVRVVRSYKEKRSNYAPSEDCPVRYDGVYRILRCWRKEGVQGHLMCRYLFMRCDNAPAPWSAEETGDVVRLEIPKEAAEEMAGAKGKIHEMTDKPHWDWLSDKGCWGWAKPPPPSQRTGAARGSADPNKKSRTRVSEQEKALREFNCRLCKATLEDPIRTPCGHNFCKACLEKKFSSVGDAVAPTGSRGLRVRKVLKPCPACNTDICDFMATAQVNREMAEIIAKLRASVAAAREEAARVTAEAGATAAAIAGASGSEEGEEAEETDGKPGTATETEAEPTATDPAKPAEQPSSSTLVADEPPLPAAGGATEPTATTAGGHMEVDPGPVDGLATVQPTVAADKRGSDHPPAPAAPAEKPFKWAVELSALSAEFPEADPALVQALLEDQEGEMADVRVLLRKVHKPVAQRRKPAAKDAGDEPPAKKARGSKKVATATVGVPVAVPQAGEGGSVQAPLAGQAAA